MFVIKRGGEDSTFFYENANSCFWFTAGVSTIWPIGWIWLMEPHYLVPSAAPGLEWSHVQHVARARPAPHTGPGMHIVPYLVYRTGHVPFIWLLNWSHTTFATHGAY